jgi:hypothetical protein
LGGGHRPPPDDDEWEDVSMVAAWITIDDLADATVDPDVAQDAIDAASFVLFHLSGRKYGGVRTVRETYCQTGLDYFGMGTYYGTQRYLLPGAHGYPALPLLEHGVVTNQLVGAGGLCSACGCPHTIRLRGGPILSVQEVWSEGHAIPLSDVVIYDYRYLAAGTGNCWQTCGDLEVTYTYGAPPPTMGKLAAKALANEYVLAVTGDEECALPQRITSISRQGESWTLLDPQEFLDKGRTGIYQVDLFLATVNPDGAKLRPRVFSPDVHRGRSYRRAGPVVAPGGQMAAPTPMVMSAQTSTQAPPDSSTTVIVFAGRPLRWVVPGSFTQESPPTLVVRPSGEEVLPDTLSWRSGNFTLDLSSTQVEQLLPPGSVLVVSSTDDAGNTTGDASYPVEWRTL